MNKNGEQLHGLMCLHNLTRAETAQALDTHKSTIDSWLAPEGASSARGMPDSQLKRAKRALPKMAKKLRRI